MLCTGAPDTCRHLKAKSDRTFIYSHNHTLNFSSEETKELFGLVVLPCFIFIGLRVFMQLLNLECDVIGGLITPVHSLKLS